MNTRDNTTVHCCAECGEEGGAVSLKTCKSCMLDCSICFLPMPVKLISCVSLPPATILSVPINDYAKANVKLGRKAMEVYYPCCGKSICGGCVYSFIMSGNYDRCPFCNAETLGKTGEEHVQEIMKRVRAKDAGAIHALASYHNQGTFGLLQDRTKAIALWKQAAELGSSSAHYHLGEYFREGGDLKKTKFHYEAAAMLGDEVARNNLGSLEVKSGNMEQAVKHWTIAASAGSYKAMNVLKTCFEEGYVSRESIDSTLAAYNSCCAEMRSEARDASIRALTT
jgi:TPR repeat protein